MVWLNYFPRRKEWLAALQMAISLLAYWTYYVVDIFDADIYDMYLFEHQTVCCMLFFAALYYSLGTWFWFSALPDTRMFIRIHSILVYGILIYLLNLTQRRYLSNYYPIIGGFLNDRSVMSDEDERMANGIFYVEVLTAMAAVVMVVQADYIVVHIVHLLDTMNDE